MEEVFPPKRPKIKLHKPFAPGTLVVPRTPTGVWLSQDHREHVFEVLEARLEKFTNSGWLQMARCVSCHSDPIGPFDAEFYQIKADKEYILVAMRNITLKRNALLLARRELNGRIG